MMFVQPSKRRSNDASDGVVMLTSMSELAFFLLFFFLILLGAIAKTESFTSRAPSQKVPIFVVDGTEKFYFGSRSSTVSEEFEEYLRGSLAPKIAESIQDGGYVDPIIEVIGHTDERTLRRHGPNCSNIDFQLKARLTGISHDDPGHCPARKGEIHFVDNAGLGLSRAVETARILMDTTDLAAHEKRFIVLTGAHLNHNSNLGARGYLEQKDDKQRRRIEIRIRRPFPTPIEVEK